MSSQPLVPHFDLPFRFAYRAGKPSVVCVEQDTNDDVFNCVVAILRTHEGFRPELPEFGLPEQTFALQPVDVPGMEEDIITQEPRAAVAISQEPDRFDEHIARLTVKASTRGASLD